jgi:hypothetical protein
MLLATMSLLIPAAGRLDLQFATPLGLPPAFLGLWLTVAFVAWACWHDRRKRGRIHPAYVYGGLLLVASVPLRRWIGMQDWWSPIAQWIVG